MQDLKLEPTVEFLRSGKSSNGDGDNMEFSDSELDEPHPRYKGPAEKSIAHLKVCKFIIRINDIIRTFQTLYF